MQLRKNGFGNGGQWRLCAGRAGSSEFFRKYVPFLVCNAIWRPIFFSKYVAIAMQFWYYVIRVEWWCLRVSAHAYRNAIYEVEWEMFK